MKIIDELGKPEKSAKKHKKPVLALGLLTDGAHLEKAVPYLSAGDLQKLRVEGGLTLLCDDMEEARRLYRQTIGDDGPNETNRYVGPERVYALLVGDTGKALTENT